MKQGIYVDKLGKWNPTRMSMEVSNYLAYGSLMSVTFYTFQSFWEPNWNRNTMGEWKASTEYCFRVPFTLGGIFHIVITISFTPKMLLLNRPQLWWKSCFHPHHHHHHHLHHHRTEAVHSVALWTRVTLQVWACVKVCTEAVHSVVLWTRVTLQLWACVNVCTEAVHSVALWTRVTLQLWACVEVCTEAVHSVALWTRVTLQLWLHYRFGHVLKYVPKQSIP